MSSWIIRSFYSLPVLVGICPWQSLLQNVFPLGNLEWYFEFVQYFTSLKEDGDAWMKIDGTDWRTSKEKRPRIPDGRLSIITEFTSCGKSYSVEQYLRHSLNTMNPVPSDANLVANRNIRSQRRRFEDPPPQKKKSSTTTTKKV